MALGIVKEKLILVLLDAVRARSWKTIKHAPRHPAEKLHKIIIEWKRTARHARNLYLGQIKDDVKVKTFKKLLNGDGEHSTRI